VTALSLVFAVTAGAFFAPCFFHGEPGISPWPTNLLMGLLELGVAIYLAAR
jgi:hypothetical protein